jgi:sulfofructose kinase
MRMPISLPVRAEEKADFVALGECSLDYAAVVDAWPHPDEKRALSAMRVGPGGQAATAARVCRELGWRARLICCVGDDPSGVAALAPARAVGVDVRAVIRHGVPTRQAIVLVDGATGARTVLESRDAGLVIGADEVPPDWVVTSRLLLVDASSVGASIRAAGAARRRGVPVIVDVDGPVGQVETLLTLVDVLVIAGSALEAMTGTGDRGSGLRRLAGEYPAPVIVVTLGAEGSLALCGGTELRTRAPLVDVVDTTGAGDAFRGGLAAGWLRQGAEADLALMLTYANAVAALSCRALGAQGSLPTEAELRRVL